MVEPAGHCRALRTFGKQIGESSDAAAGAPPKLTGPGMRATLRPIMHFELVRQISIALENQPGALHRAVAELARRGINIQGMSVLDSIDQGVVRLRTSDPALTREALDGIGLKLMEADVFEVDLPDKPGRLAELCRALAEGGVNIDYAYGSSQGSATRTRMFLKASPVERAKAIFERMPPE
jgi:hypothetical protein